MRRGCPDDGACHHRCVSGCFRVAYASPLSAYGEEWTPADVATHTPVVHRDPITERIITA